MTSEIAIDAQHIVPQFSDHQERKPLSIRTEPGRILCFLGKDGTVLDNYLRSLAGIHPLQSGTLSMYGRTLDQIADDDWVELRQRLAYISRETPLLSVVNGFLNLMIPAIYHEKGHRNELTKKAQQLLVDINFQGDTNTLPAYLSPLERVQLSILRAVMLEPDVLLLDDPWLAIDPFEYLHLNQFFVRWSESRTLITATSNLGFVRSHASTIYFVTTSEVLQFASWQSLCNSENLEVQDYLALHNEHQRAT